MHRRSWVALRVWDSVSALGFASVQSAPRGKPDRANSVLFRVAG